MDLLHRFENWGDHHHPKWVDIIRILLGVYLCYKGVDFLMDTGSLIGLMSSSALSFGSFIIVLLAHVVPFAHILGGLLLILGLFTRFACLIQIPILIGALFFIKTSNDASTLTYAPLSITIVVLLLLVYFLIASNGPWAFKLGEEEPKKMAH